MRCANRFAADDDSTRTTAVPPVPPFGTLMRVCVAVSIGSPQSLAHDCGSRRRVTSVKPLAITGTSFRRPPALLARENNVTRRHSSRRQPIEVGTHLTALADTLFSLGCCVSPAMTGRNTAPSTALDPRLGTTTQQYPELSPRPPPPPPPAPTFSSPAQPNPLKGDAPATSAQLVPNPLHVEPGTFSLPSPQPYYHYTSPHANPSALPNAHTHTHTHPRAQSAHPSPAFTESQQVASAASNNGARQVDVATKAGAT